MKPNESADPVQGRRVVRSNATTKSRKVSLGCRHLASPGPNSCRTWCWGGRFALAVRRECASTF